VSGTGSLRFGLVATLVALAGLAAVSPLVLARWPEAAAWTLGAWLLLAAIGVADGVWLQRRYGRTGSGFLLALVVGILARIAAVCAGCVLAFRQGGNAPWGFLAGVAAGFVPLQAFEVIWFLRLGRGRSRKVH
jgi:hypothetical protein